MHSTRARHVPSEEVVLPQFYPALDRGCRDPEHRQTKFRISRYFVLSVVDKETFECDLKIIGISMVTTC